MNPTIHFLGYFLKSSSGVVYSYNLMGRGEDERGVVLLLARSRCDFAHYLYFIEAFFLKTIPIFV